MTERLTSSSTSRGPRWIGWIPPLVLATSLAAILSRLPVPWPVTDPPPASFHHGLVQRAVALLGPDRAWGIHLPFALLLIWMCGELLERLVPPKTPLPSKILARSLGMVAAATLLHGWFQQGLGPSPALPASATLLTAWSAFLRATEKPSPRLAALAGLLAGLSFSLDPFTGLGALPLGVWTVSTQMRGGRPRFGWTMLFAVGGLVGSFPSLGRVTQTLFRASEVDPARILSLLTAWLPRLGIAGLLLVVLAFAVGLLQKNRIIAGLLVPTILLYKAASPWVQGLDADRKGAALVPVVVLFAYGAFRLARGFESGVHGINPGKTRWVAPVLLVLILVGFKIWTGFLFAG